MRLACTLLIVAKNMWVGAEEFASKLALGGLSPLIFFCDLFLKRFPTAGMDRWPLKGA
jgi:hypothetical protein